MTELYESMRAYAIIRKQAGRQQQQQQKKQRVECFSFHSNAGKKLINKFHIIISNAYPTVLHGFLLLKNYFFFSTLKISP